MKCTNKAEVWVESGFHGKMVELPCGSTGPHGIVELCQDCLAKQTQLYPQGWRYHPGDICCHGVYHDPEHDCSCADCENGVPAPSKLLCYCGKIHLVTLEIDGGSDIECNRCGTDITVPLTLEELAQDNNAVARDLEARSYTGNLIIMRRDELNEEHFVLKIKDDEAAQYTIEGVKQAFPESQIEVEREKNMQFEVEQFLLDQ